jgi:alkylation response protein AidB-like acyl-CoA dehydrogenase
MVLFFGRLYQLRAEAAAGGPMVVVRSPSAGKTTLHHSLERWLQPAASGEKIIAFALSEPCCSSGAFSLEAKAERRGGSWVINGTKL